MNFKPAYDLLGHPVPPTPNVKELDWSIWNDTAPPSWLSVVGTLSIHRMDATGDVGRAWVATGAVAGNVASVKLAFGINLQAVEAVEVRVDGLRFDTDDASKFDFLMACHNHVGKQGVLLYQPAQTSGWSMRSRIYNVGGNVEASFPYSVAGGGVFNGNRSKSLALRVMCREKRGYLLGGDDIIGEFGDASKWVNANGIRPGLEFVTRENVAHTMSFTRLRVRVYTD
ncbi:hypothetical protein [Caldimonas brevitalea]|uniref:Uncharacterized protein n=1 Tax=Caldimonas brevitalea TaxID=413882 RepID=A0A0G3BR59_9BURK|nr:hypothetical protein [Caldimonas brevitalea]AKJ29836.1 hypothetical protein AAW51_3145 [Caldimonas brevitalea]